MQKITGWILSLVVLAVPFGFIASTGFEAVQRWIRQLAEMPAWMKRLVFPVIALAVVAVGQLAGVKVVCEPDTSCLETLDAGMIETIVRGIVASLVGYATHFIFKGAKR